MKKMFLVLLVFISAVLVMSSCKAHKTCPAYTNGSTEIINLSTVEDNA